MPAAASGLRLAARARGAQRDGDASASIVVAASEGTAFASSVHGAGDDEARQGGEPRDAPFSSEPLLLLLLRVVVAFFESGSCRGRRRRRARPRREGQIEAHSAPAGASTSSSSVLGRARERGPSGE